MKSELFRPISACLLATCLLTTAGCSSNSDDDKKQDGPKEDVSTPTKPAGPADPAAPIEPEDSAGPIDPADPTEPADPAEPTDPPLAEDSTFSFDMADHQVNETTDILVISVSRSGNTTQAGSVSYAAIGGSAMAVDDYALTPAELHWEAGETGSKTITIEVVADAEIEEDETVELELSNPIGGVLGTQQTTTLTIQDTSTGACVDAELKTVASSLTLAAGCYNVLSNISVSNGAVLTLAPGVTMKFAEGYGLDIESDGQLIAEGTAEQPIVFTSVLPAPGYWDGIEISSVAASSLKHVVVEYGGSPSSLNPANIGLWSNGRAAITDSIIRYSGSYGISMSGNQRITEFASNTLTANEGAPVRMHTNSLGILDSGSVYLGNVTANGEDRDYIRAVGDSITSNQTWKQLGVPYRLAEANTDVRAVLKIEPGVTLIFPKDGQLEIESAGALEAVGTIEQPITFTGLEASPGFWKGVLFVSNNNENIMDHTIVEYGGAGGLMSGNVGTFGQNNRLSISNSLIQHSERAGLDLYAGTVVQMDAVTLTGNNLPIALDFNDVGQLDPNSNYTGNTRDIIYVTGRKISTAQTAFNILPYELPGTTAVDITASFTVDPGVELRFRANGGFIINDTGALIAKGTAERPVTFTGIEKTKGFWRGIEFRSNSQANIIDHAVVEFAGAPEGLVHALIGFWGANSNGVVSNTVLRSSLTHGISVDADTTGEFSVGNSFVDIDGEELRVRM